MYDLLCHHKKYWVHKKAQTLIDANADLNIEDNGGKTAVQRAQESPDLWGRRRRIDSCDELVEMIRSAKKTQRRYRLSRLSRWFKFENL